MKTYPSVGLKSPKVLIPNEKFEMEKWAVVACDQFTSQPTYWQTVEKLVGTSPSTYHLILPEAYLGTDLEGNHSSQVNQNMEAYLNSSVFREVDGMIYIERYFENSVRKGLITALDLEQYDFSSSSRSLIRATEGTIIDRLPPRIKIRAEALLEVSHILVLIDDPHMTVIDPIANEPHGLEPLYDFDLMQKSGHIKGYHIASSLIENSIIHSLEKLKSQKLQSKKYQTTNKTPPLLYAVGDGNHSLATAKSIWEKNKHSLPEDHPSRYALVEIVNLHDKSIQFEAIHRLLKRIESDWLQSFQKYFAGNLTITKVPDLTSIINEVSKNHVVKQVFGSFDNHGFWLMELKHPVHTLTVGSVQKCLDDLIARSVFKNLDYIHGEETILRLGTKIGNAAIYLPSLRKDSFFQSIIKDGAFPRKTFSMGEAHQKRFYLECRKIK